MNIRVGVIGPKDSLNQIMAVEKEFSEAVIVPFSYETLPEIDGIIEENAYQIDQWLFSGILNYTYAIDKKLTSANEATYPIINGSTFFGTLLEAQLEGDRVFKRISIDTITDKEIGKILAYYRLDALQYKNLPFKSYEHVGEQVDFHHKLYLSGETDVAITFIMSTYMELKRLGVPVYRVTPSYVSIEQSFRLLIERGLSMRYKNAQMAVIGCKVKFDANQDDIYYSFKMQHKEIELRRSLLNITEKVNGSLMQIGDGQFMVFTTRGEINRETETDLFRMIEDVRAQEGIRLSITVGYGETVLQAEQNVRNGFDLQRKQKIEQIIIIDEDQHVEILSDQDIALSYQMKLGKQWQERLERSGISSGIISKIMAYSKQYNRPDFTSQDLARWLKSTERNGRRIVSQLESGGIIEQCGEIHDGSKGRPRKVYSFKKHQ